MHHPAIQISDDKRRSLVEVATGRKPAGIVFRNLKLVNVYSGEVLEREVGVSNGRIAAVNSCLDFMVGEDTEIVDAKGKFLVPGLLDAHVHIESSMLTPARFAEASLEHGITGVFYDPHEIANVLGLQGVAWMAEDLERTPLNGFLTVPSCVPATSEKFETSGARLGPEETNRALKWDRTVALGEMMNYPGVLSIEEDVWKKVRRARELGKIVEGHASGLTGEELCGYRAAGIGSDHEAVKKKEGMERIRRGFWTYIREGSAWPDLKEVIKAITEENLDADHVCLVTDDRDPGDLLYQGGVDHVVNRAVQEGVAPLNAIKMATLNTAKRFGLDEHIGSITPGRRADFFFTSDLEPMKAEKTFIGGRDVSRISWDDSSLGSVTGTIKVKNDSVSPGSFRQRGKEKKYGIDLSGEGIVTKLVELSGDKDEKDFIDLAVVERHKRTGNVSRTYLKGFGLNSGAVASSVAHDSHNIVVAGCDRNDMAESVRRLIQIGGGQVLIENEKVIAEVELPVAGLMSPVTPEKLARDVKELRKALRERGCRLRQPLMTLSSLALPVIPEARLTDKGLMDVRKFELIT